MFKSIFFDLILIIGIVLLIFGVIQLRIDQPFSENISQPNSAEITEKQNYNLLDKENKSNYQDNFYNFPALQLIRSEVKLLDLDYPRIKVPAKKVKITIPRGVSSIEIADIMEENNLVTAEKFLQAVRMFNLETEIKFGDYTFNSKDNLIDIFDKILIKRR